MLNSEVTLTENKSRAKKGKANMPGLLDGINLPDEDKDKPADVNVDPNAGDDGIAADPAPTELPNAETPTPPKEGETPAPTTPEVTTPPATPETPPADVTPKPAEPLPPFHEHPDWKKAQDKIKELEDKVAAQTPTPPADPYAGMTPLQIASARIRKEVADKTYEPKDAVELQTKLIEYKEEEEQKVQAKTNEIRQTITKQIDDTFAEMGVTDPATQDKIIEQANKWREEGMTGQSVRTLKLAKEFLEKTGALTPATTPAAPAVTPAPAAPVADPVKAAKDNVNSKIRKPGDPGNTTVEQKTTPIIKNGANMSLDRMVQELGSNLDKPQG